MQSRLTCLQQTKDPNLQPSPGAGPEQLPVIEVDAIQLMQVGLDQLPVLEDGFPRDALAAGVRRDVVPAVEALRVLISVTLGSFGASLSAGFFLAGAGFPRLCQNRSAVARSVAESIITVIAACLIAGHGTLSATISSYVAPRTSRYSVCSSRSPRIFWSPSFTWLPRATSTLAETTTWIRGPSSADTGGTLYTLPPIGSFSPPSSAQSPRSLNAIGYGAGCVIGDNLPWPSNFTDTMSIASIAPPSGDHDTAAFPRYASIRGPDGSIS